MAGCVTGRSRNSESCHSQEAIIGVNVKYSEWLDAYARVYIANGYTPILPLDCNIFRHWCGCVFNTVVAAIFYVTSEDRVY